MTGKTSLFIGTVGDEGGHAELRVRVITQHGRELIDLRTFERLGISAGIFSPTKAGVSIEPEDIPALIRLLRTACEEPAEGSKP